MENLEKLEKELEIAEKIKKEEEIKLKNNIFRFISTTNKNDIVDWGKGDKGYFITISKNNIKIVIEIELFYRDDVDYYYISIENNMEPIYYFYFFSNSIINNNNKDDYDYKKAIEIIEEKMEQAKELEHKRLQKEQEKEKENIIKYCKERIAQYQSYNQILG